MLRTTDQTGVKIVTSKLIFYNEVNFSYKILIQFQLIFITNVFICFFSFIS